MHTKSPRPTTDVIQLLRSRRSAADVVGKVDHRAIEKSMTMIDPDRDGMVDDNYLVPSTKLAIESQVLVALALVEEAHCPP